MRAARPPVMSWQNQLNSGTKLQATSASRRKPTGSPRKTRMPRRIITSPPSSRQLRASSTAQPSGCPRGTNIAAPSAMQTTPAVHQPKPG